MRDLRKILTGDIQEIGLVEKADRDNQVPPAMFTSVGLHDEIAGIPADGTHPPKRMSSFCAARRDSIEASSRVGL
jgi:hypothetical protein